jgi:iron complex transport system substrate-binding protein
MNKKYITYVAAILVLAVVLSGAFVYLSINQPGSDNAQTTVSVVDDEGYVLNMTSCPQRIVSLAPSNTQILFAIGAGDKVVGVTDYDKYPYDFSAWIAEGNMTSIGGYSTPNKETIASLEPDLIVATPINDVDVVTLRTLGYNVLVINPDSINGVLHDIALIGNATGNQVGATSLADNIVNQINSVASKIAAANIQEKPKVYYEIWDDPLMSAGGTTWINDIINKVGAVNIFANETQQYPTISSESIVQMNPDVILLPSSMGTGTITPDSVKNRSGWSTINAVKNNRIYVIDGDLFAEAGSRIAEQVSAIAQAIYPDLFNSP